MEKREKIDKIKALLNNSAATEGEKQAARTAIARIEKTDIDEPEIKGFEWEFTGTFTAMSTGEPPDKVDREAIFRWAVRNGN